VQASEGRVQRIKEGSSSACIANGRCCSGGSGCCPATFIIWRRHRQRRWRWQRRCIVGRAAGGAASGSKAGSCSGAAAGDAASAAVGAVSPAGPPRGECDSGGAAEQAVPCRAAVAPAGAQAASARGPFAAAAAHAGEQEPGHNRQRRRGGSQRAGRCGCSAQALALRGVQLGGPHSGSCPGALPGKLPYMSHHTLAAAVCCHVVYFIPVKGGLVGSLTRPHTTGEADYRKPVV
jgi:hypothetical protein